MKKNMLALLILSFLALTSFAKTIKKLHPGMNTIFLPDRVSKKTRKRKIAIDIYIPKTRKAKAYLLVFPGWNFSRTRWHKETSLLEHCEKHGIIAIFPEMKKTLYASKYFKETYLRWSITPGSLWVKNVLIKELQKRYRFLMPDGENYLLGLSTGGRGVLLTVLSNPDLFKAAASLSGDFNQAKMPRDKLMKAVYGSFHRFKSRWKKVDNVEYLVKNRSFKTAIYLGHGKKDKVVPFRQSLSLYNVLKKTHPKLKLTLKLSKNSNHNFIYWNLTIPDVMKFFFDK